MPPSPRLQPEVRKAIAAVVVGAAGLALLVVWPPAAVAVTLAAAFVGVFSVVTRLSTPTLFGCWIALAFYGAALARASGSPLLAAAGVIALFGIVPTEPIVRRLGYRTLLGIPVTTLVALALFATSWPFGWWGLAVVPPVMFGAFMSVGVLRGLRTMKSSAPTQWPAGIGDRAPAVRGATREGTPFDLADDRGRWVMLCFLRGDWCAVCQIMLRIYKKAAPVLAKRNVKLVAVSPTGGPEALDLARELGLEYSIVVDSDLAVARAFGALFPKGAPDGSDEPLPVSFLIDPDGVIRAASRSDDVTSFRDPLAVLAHVA